MRWLRNRKSVNFWVSAFWSYLIEEFGGGQILGVWKALLESASGKRFFDGMDQVVSRLRSFHGSDLIGWAIVRRLLYAGYLLSNEKRAIVGCLHSRVEVSSTHDERSNEPA